MDSPVICTNKMQVLLVNPRNSALLSREIKALHSLRYCERQRGGGGVVHCADTAADVL